MQHTVGNLWLNPSLVAFAEEQHAQRGRRRKKSARAGALTERLTANVRGKHRSKKNLALRASVLGLLLSSAAFSYFAWGNTLGSFGSLPGASVFGLTPEKDSPVDPPARGAELTDVTRIGSASIGSARMDLANVESASIGSANTGSEVQNSSDLGVEKHSLVEHSLEEQVYHLRAENHALLLQLSKLREALEQVGNETPAAPSVLAESMPGERTEPKLAAITPIELASAEL